MSNSALAPGVVLRSPKREYTICRVLGQGGFGITYMVETPLKMDGINFKGQFAVKEHFVQMLCARELGTSNIHYLPNSAQEVERSKKAFIAEAQRLQKFGINHRNIVEVSEVFECNRTAYYVMEYIDGGSLADYVKAHGGRLSWAETAQMMRPICEAVAMLHSNKVAHYDIKPQNIMIQQDSSGVRPVLIDFGLAKHYDGQGQATSSIAAAGYTPGYAPIEQYTGLRQFSPATDVYALSATICFCLTGHAPAKADDLDLNALCDELLTVGVDASVANVLIRAIELRAAKRPADAGALAAALFASAPLAAVHQPQQPAQQPTVSAEPSTAEPSTALAPSEPSTAPAPSEPSTAPAPSEPSTALAPSEPSTAPVPAGPSTAPVPAEPVQEPEPEPEPEQDLRRRWLVPVIIFAIVVIPFVLFLTLGGSSDSEGEGLSPADLGPAPIETECTEQIRTEQKAEVSEETKAEYRTTPRNLDLQVTLDGEKYYISVDEWNMLSSSEQGCLEKQGIVIDYSGVKKFVVKLNVERHGSGYKLDDSEYFTWDEAKRWVLNLGSGWRLPNYDEGNAMADQCEAVCAAIKAFGCDGDPAKQYWTSTTDANYSSSVWYFNLYIGGVGSHDKNFCEGVRAVREL